MRTTRWGAKWSSRQELGEPGWDAPQSNSIEVLTVIGPQCAKRRAAQPVCLLQYRIEHRGEVAGRGIDDLQHLGGRRLLLTRFGKFSLTVGKLTFEIGYAPFGIG